MSRIAYIVCAYVTVAATPLSSDCVGVGAALLLLLGNLAAKLKVASTELVNGTIAVVVSVTIVSGYSV